MNDDDDYTVENWMIVCAILVLLIVVGATIWEVFFEAQRFHHP